MSDAVNIFNDLAPLGFPGWEASHAYARSADTNGGAALVQGIRRAGSQLVTYIEARNGAALFDEMARTINLYEDWSSDAARHRRKASFAEWQAHLATSRDNIPEYDQDAPRHSFAHIAPRV